MQLKIEVEWELNFQQYTPIVQEKKIESKISECMQLIIPVNCAEIWFSGTAKESMHKPESSPYAWNG